MEIELILDKVTKGTHRYVEVSNNLDMEFVMPTVYIKTEALEAEFGDIPKYIVVTVEEG